VNQTDDRPTLHVGAVGQRSDKTMRPSGTVPQNDIFERYLDLGPLRGRRRGTVKCIFQPRDRTPSLSVDLDAGVFHCFGCGVEGGFQRFAELVGEAAPRTMRSTWAGSELEAARRKIVRDARSEKWNSEGARLLYDVSDWIRMSRRQIEVVRRLAHDPDDYELVRAAHLETFVHSVESELDDLLSTGRID